VVRLQSLLNKINFQSNLYRSIFVFSSGTVIAQLIGICALPFLTRLYTPSEIGCLSLFLSFFGFWVTSIALRYENALMIAKDNAESYILYCLVRRIIFFMSLIGVPVLYILQQTDVFKLQVLPFWAPLTVFVLSLGYGLFTVNKAWALRAGLVVKISQATITRASTIAGTKLGLGMIGCGIFGLFVAEMAGAITSTWKLEKSTKEHIAASRPHSIKYSQFWKTAFKYKKFPLIETPSAWIDALAMLLPLPMVASLYGAEAAGWFGMARMVLSLPNAQIGVAVGNAFQMELAKSLREKEKQQARTLFYLLFKKLSLIGLIPLFVTIAVLPWAFPIIFGESWESAGLIAPILAPWIYVAFVISPLSIALPMLQAQEWKVIYDSIAFGLLMATYLVADKLKLSFYEYCSLMTFAQTIGYIIYALLLCCVVENKLKK
jgi:O-antigen/teichoic acid export membrane protein